MVALLTVPTRADVLAALLRECALGFPIAPWRGPVLVGVRTVQTITAAGVVEEFEPIYAAAVKS